MHLPVVFLILAGLTVAGARCLRGVWAQPPRLQRQPGAGVPDRISLVATDHAWERPEITQPLLDGLAAEGVVDAGTYAVAPLPGVFLKLLVHSADKIAANVYDHRAAGSWLELVSRCADGTTLCVTGHAATGLSALPGHQTIHDPGASVASLVARLRAERPPGELIGATIDNAVGLFEDGYASLAAERKTRGLTQGEIARVAARRPQKRTAQR